jgi:hypothetical protein
MQMCSRDFISVEFDVVSLDHFAEYFISDKGMRCKCFDEQRKNEVVDLFSIENIYCQNHKGMQ